MLRPPNPLSHSSMQPVASVTTAMRPPMLPDIGKSSELAKRSTTQERRTNHATASGELDPRD